MRVTLLSLEPWDDTWRRNQHLAHRLVAQGVIRELTFVEPAGSGLALRARRSQAGAGIAVVKPPLLVPRSWGGWHLLGRWLRWAARGADVVWVNDPVAGAALLPTPTPLLYDVTDDWRSLDQGEQDRRRIIAAEDRLAGTARTVVCSAALQDRWRERYGVEAALVPNGVDVAALRAARPQRLAGAGPHAVYVGTLHESRIDVALVRDLAAQWPGTLHLVGPIGLPDEVVAQLRADGVDLPGPVPSDQVPGWLTAADVLVCPHTVDAFTLSLDAIKSHEYLATDRPVVATPSSGFQALEAPGLTVTDRDWFVAAAIAAAEAPAAARRTAVDWDERATAFGQVLLESVSGGAR